MLKNRLSVESFNLVGSTCSIIALLLTVSNRLSIASLLQIVFGVLFGLSIGGLLMNWLLKTYRYNEIFLFESFYSKMLYWLTLTPVCATVTIIAGKIGYWFMNMFLEMVIVPVFELNSFPIHQAT